VGKPLKKYKSIALIFLIITVMFLYSGQHGVTLKAESTNEVLLPEITNCTVQNSVHYAQDFNPYHLMNVYLPVGKGPFPAIIYIHAGGWTRGSRADYNATAFFYAERGIAGFAIDYTLTTQNTTAWPQAIRDVVMAIRFVRENAMLYRVDPAKIAVFGSSAGGHLAALAGTLSGNEPFLVGASGNPKVSSRVSLVVDYSGPTDLEYIGKNEKNFFIYNITKNLFGNVTYEMNPSLWLQASPVTYISSNDPVFFIAHGTNDTVVPIGISESFTAKLEAAGVETHFVTVEGGDHDILTSQQENLIVRDSLEPLLKRVFNLDQLNIPEFLAPILLMLVLALTLIASVIFLVIQKKAFFNHSHTNK
jgi:acetyl esterase/lipase